MGSYYTRPNYSGHRGTLGRHSSLPSAFPDWGRFSMKLTKKNLPAIEAEFARKGVETLRLATAHQRPP